MASLSANAPPKPTKPVIRVQFASKHRTLVTVEHQTNLAINPATLSNVSIDVVHPRRIWHDRPIGTKQILPKTISTI